MHLVEVYELYIEALIRFYNSKPIGSSFSNFDFILWYDLNSSKSIFDYTSSKHLTYVIKLREYMQVAYKYNNKNVTKLTLKVQEYVSTNLYNIFGLLKLPLQKILKDEDIIKSDIFSSSKYHDTISIDVLFSYNSELLHTQRIENILTKWNDSSITIVAQDIVNKYSEFLYETNINQNSKLMYWVEQMSIDEHKTNMLDSSIMAMIVLKNFEYVGIFLENKSNLKKEDNIDKLLVDVDQKLNAIYIYSIYTITGGRENIVSDLWNDIINQRNNIFNILDWLNKSVSKKNIPYWPNDKPCNNLYMKNILQLASVSADMLYDVTLTSMYKALENDGIDDELEEAEAVYMLEDLERAKHTYKYIIKNIKNLIKVNTLYIKFNVLLNLKLKHLAEQELAKCIKYKIFAITEFILPAFRKIQYYKLVEPEFKQDYSEHFVNMNKAFYNYFGKKKEPSDETALELINTNEHNIIYIYNKLRQKHFKKKKGNRYMRVLKYNMICVKRMYRHIIKELKKITILNNEKGLENNYEEIKQRLLIAVALIMGDFIRYDKYVERQPQNIPLFSRKFQFTISEIDIAQENVNINYMKIFNKMNRTEYCSAKKTLNNSKMLNVRELV